MKVAIYIKNSLGKAWGGGFTHAESLLDGILKYGTGKHQFLILSESKIDQEFVDGYEGIWIDELVSTGKWGRKKEIDLSEYLKGLQVDIILLSQPHTSIIPEFPFIAINWDLAHITTFNFPEIKRSMELRQAWYEDIIPKALFVFAESEAGKQELIKYLNLPEHKIKVLPLFPGKSIQTKLDGSRQKEMLDQAGLQRHEFFFYPAQFWTLKNHVTLIKAFQKIHRQHPKIKLVFSGSDKGNHDHVVQFINDEKLQDHIISLGFVEEEMMISLYKNAIALVFPTLLGPTNMPPLEAIALNCPVICSDFEGHREQLNDAALYIDPMNIGDIAEKMQLLISDREARMRLIDHGMEISQSSKFKLEVAINELEENLDEVASVRSLWK